ncbi:MAG: cell division protein ZapA [Terriglobales bacterium]
MTVQVEIYDQGYSLTSAGSEAHTRRLADRVDAAMRQIARQTRVIDSLRVAVLAAVNLADENEALRERCRHLEAAVSEKTAEYHQLLDGALAQAS